MPKVHTYGITVLITVTISEDRVQYSPEILSIQTAIELDFKLLVRAKCNRACNADALQLAPSTPPRLFRRDLQLYNFAPNITICTIPKTSFSVNLKYIEVTG